MSDTKTGWGWTYDGSGGYSIGRADDPQSYPAAHVQCRDAEIGALACRLIVAALSAPPPQLVDPVTHQATDTASAALLELAKDWRAQADRMEQSSRHNRLFSNVWRAHADELERALASLPAPAAPQWRTAAEELHDPPKFPDLKVAPAAPEEEKPFSYREGDS